MNWVIDFLPEAIQDMNDLDGSQRKYVIKALQKVRVNPLPQSEGGYGKPLGNKNGIDLSGLLKIKIKAAGLRIVYKLIRDDDKMLVLVIGARADNEVYEIAGKRNQGL